MNTPYRILALLLALLLSATSQAEEDILPPDQAFAFTLDAANSNTLRAQWDIAEGYYLYRNKIRFQSDTPGVELGEPRLPAGKIQNDEFFGDVEIYRGTVVVDIPLKHIPDASDTLIITATSQGCADLGVCYPPHNQRREVYLPVAAAAPPGSGALAGLGGLTSLAGALGGEDDVLDPDQAFIFSAIAVEPNEIIARWQIAPDHYLYRNKFQFELGDASGVVLGNPIFTPGKVKDDEFFGRVEVYYNEAEARLPLQRTNFDPTTITLNATYQGCAELQGICYPPQKKAIHIDLPAASKGTSPAFTPTAAAPVPASPTPLNAPVSEQDSLADRLATDSMLATIALFFGLGLLLSFTPCVFPMIPILSSIIVGQGEGLTTRKAFTLSLVYVLAMALTYTVAGVLAGMFGAELNLQAAFQNPWILIPFAAIFVALSLSMFGFYELQLPGRLQSKLAEFSNRQRGGSLLGVAIMGFLSALIVGPCVAPPLAGALIYIGQSGDALLGGLALFALSLGMGAPLLLIGTSAGKLLPRAGGWMDAVKAVFGVLLLGVAIWMLERILPGTLVMIMWALLGIVSAIYMGALDTLGETASGWRRLWKGLGFALLAYGILLLIGASAGNSDPLNPLKGLGSGSAQQAGDLKFKPIKGLEGLEKELAATNTPVMLDFYADWCISCKEMEKYTFSDPAVQETLQNVTLLKADVTANDEIDQALLTHFNLFGPPAILYFGSDGREVNGYRVVGYMPAAEFASHSSMAIGR